MRVLKKPALARVLRSSFVVGAVLLVVVALFWITPTIMVGNIEAKLIGYDASTASYQRLFNTKSWWQIMQITLFEPLALVLTLISILIIA